MAADLISLHATPEPWLIDGDRGVIFGEAAADTGELPICQLLHDATDNADAERCAADARLIRAALPMLAALKEIAALCTMTEEPVEDDYDTEWSGGRDYGEDTAAWQAAMAAVSPAKDPLPGHSAG
jgi:hypothetical protein